MSQRGNLPQNRGENKKLQYLKPPPSYVWSSCASHLQTRVKHMFQVSIYMLQIFMCSMILCLSLSHCTFHKHTFIYLLLKFLDISSTNTSRSPSSPGMPQRGLMSAATCYWQFIVFAFQMTCHVPVSQRNQPAAPFGTVYVKPSLAPTCRKSCGLMEEFYPIHLEIWSNIIIPKGSDWWLLRTPKELEVHVNHRNIQWTSVAIMYFI